MFCFVYKIKRKTCITLIFVGVVACVFIRKYLVKNQDVPILLWWTPFAAVDQLIECENNYRCLVSPNRKLQNSKRLKTILFYGSQFKAHDIPISRKDVAWAMLHEESPKNLQLFLHKEGQSLFKITSTFSRHSDFPLTFQYLKSLNYLNDRRFYIDVRQKDQFLKTLAPVLYISSNCDTPSYRDSYVKELMKYIQVDSYGKCLNNKQLPKPLAADYLNDLYGDELLNFMAKYKFTIAIENAICDDYITEKLWRPLIAGSVPIYLGSPSIEDWLPNNTAILIKNFESVQHLSNYIRKVNENDVLYESYLTHKLHPSDFVNSNLSDAFSSGYYGIKNNRQHPISAFQCFVCQAVHEGKVFAKDADKLIYDCPKPVHPFNESNSWDIFWEYGKCEMKAMKFFFDDGKTVDVTEEMFVKKSLEYLGKGGC